jgi:hypothetical protein
MSLTNTLSYENLPGSMPIIILMFLLTFSNAAMGGGGEFGTTDGASIPE